MENAPRSKSLKILIFCIGALFAMPVLPSNVKSVLIGIFLAGVLVYVIDRKPTFNKWFFITNGAVFLIIALTYFYSMNSEYAIRKLTTMLSLLIFPLAFSLISKEDVDKIYKNRHQFLTTYLVAVFLLNVVSFLWFYLTHYSFEDMLIHFPTVMRVEAGKWNIHPIYLSMHCSIAILFGFYILRELRSKGKIAIILFMMITLLAFLFIYAKKGPMLALIAVFTLFVLFQRRGKLMKVYVFAILSFIALVVLVPRTRDKLIELQKIETLKEGGVTSTNIRYTIYGVAKELISDSPVIGYGIGDYNKTLIAGYKKLGDEVLIKGKYNSHNQYFSLLLIGGLLVLLIFLIMMGFNLVFAVRFNNELLILVLIFYGIVMFTENILERENGVIFFAFFLNFFASKSLYGHEEE